MWYNAYFGQGQLFGNVLAIKLRYFVINSCYNDLLALIQQ